MIIISQSPVLYLEGVRFHVKENGRLRFGVSTMRVERLEVRLRVGNPYRSETSNAVKWAGP